MTFTMPDVPQASACWKPTKRPPSYAGDVKRKSVRPFMSSIAPITGSSRVPPRPPSLTELQKNSVRPPRGPTMAVNRACGTSAAFLRQYGWAPPALMCRQG